MNAETRIFKMKVSVAILIVCAAALWLWKNHSSVPQAVTPKPQPAPAVQVATTAPAPEVAPQENPETAKPVAVEPPAIKPKTKIQTAQNQSSQKPPKEPLHDPDARDALALVGLDPQAEQYWLQAIFDTSLPDKEREDLMEDLNEVGFADPKNLTPNDLPLIVSRLQMIEQLEPNVDPFMQEHLHEAYKDLSNMYGQVTGQ
jgi:hypothetical protein